MIIGVFDSGIGGMSIVRAIRQNYPQATIVYYGDTLRVPYGQKSPIELIHLADRITHFLIEQGAKLIIDACNTTSALALDFLQQKYGAQAHIVGVLEPGAMRAAMISAQKVGVMATQATVNSGLYQQKILGKKSSLDVVSVACPLLVPFVEAADTDSERLRDVLSAYVFPMREKKIDTLVLGCTHYPFLKDSIQEMLGKRVRLVDPGQEVMGEIKEDLRQNTSETFSQNICYVSKDAVDFELKTTRLLPEHGFDAFVTLDIMGRGGHENR